MKKQKSIVLASGIVLTPKDTTTSKFVNPGPVNPVTKPINDGVAYSLDIPQSSTQHVEMRTSHVDRAIGELIRSIGYYVMFSAFTTGLAVYAKSLPILSLLVFLIFSMSFLGIWTLNWLVGILVSAEGVSLFDSWRKWRLIEREQQNRWNYYKGENK